MQLPGRNIMTLPPRSSARYDTSFLLRQPCLSLFCLFLGALLLQVSRDSADVSGTLCIELEHLCLNVSGRELLDDASLSLQPGSRYGLIGQNGSGKFLESPGLIYNVNRGFIVKSLWY